MAQLYPPYLNEVLPAFAGSTLTLSFTMNPAVASADIKGFSILFKNINNNTIITTINKEFDNENSLKSVVEKQTITFTSKKLKELTAGKFYKVQLKYIPRFSNNTAAYSAAALIKKCYSPTVTIENLSLKKINEYPHSFTGHYKIGIADSTEKIYSSKFVIRDTNGSIVAHSGIIIHNINDDTLSNEARENYNFETDLKLNTQYTCQWYVTTTNGYTVRSQKYKIIQTDGLRSSLEGVISPVGEVNRDEGYISLKILKDKLSNRELSSPKNIIISRSSSKNNFSKWSVLKTTTLKKLNSEVYKDYSVINGVSYQYAIQTLESGHKSARIKSNPIMALYDDMFLWDGTKQLKIKFNPQVSTFKPIVQEQKIETLGSKYPYIVRNGNIFYKEFSISGLISYLSDENNLFLKSNYYNVPDKDKEILSTSLDDFNLIKESTFREQALNWLSNGEPKLFKSPTEGTSLVRLMNVSLSPLATVGRMVHTFQSTAYEIGENTIQSLKNNKILTEVDIQSNQKYSYDYGTVSIGKNKSFSKTLGTCVYTGFNIKLNSNNTIYIYLNSNPNAAANYTLSGKGSSLSITSINTSHITIKEKNGYSFNFTLQAEYYKKEAISVDIKTIKTGTMEFSAFNPKTNLMKSLRNSTVKDSKSTALVITGIKITPRICKDWNIDMSRIGVGKDYATISQAFKATKSQKDVLYIARDKDTGEIKGYYLRTKDNKYYCFKANAFSVTDCYCINVGLDNTSKLLKINMEAYTKGIQLRDLLSEINPSADIIDYNNLARLYFYPGVKILASYQVKTFKANKISV